MLHDIGMLAVPQHILAKREGLTDDERRKLWLHPQVGADIIHSVPFPSPVAPLILSHHELLGRRAATPPASAATISRSGPASSPWSIASTRC